MVENLCIDEGCPNSGRPHVCVTKEDSAFMDWANGYFAAPDFSKTESGLFARDWMRHAFAAWQARAASERKQ